MNDAVRALVDLLDLETIDDNLFRGRPAPNERGRAFGGQVAAQALIASFKTVREDFDVHSVHSYFLLPGDPSLPIVYDVEHIRDGRSFQTRRVSARQHGRPIYYLTASFHRDEAGLEHQDAMPAVAPPEAGIDMLTLMKAAGHSDAPSLAREWAAVDVRYLGDSRRGLPASEEHPAQARAWMRIAERLPEESVIHKAAFTWASDIGLLAASLTAHDVRQTQIQMASLDHTIWFHRPFRADDWWLYDVFSPSAQGARGLSIGRVFAQDGQLVATVAQEGLIRPRSH